MSILDEIRPSAKTNVYDLLDEAGFDISDWVASQGRAPSPAANPKYSRNWAFIEADKVAMTIWYGSLSEQDGVVSYSRNARKIAQTTTGQTRRRAIEQDEAMRTANQQALPVVAILCAGKQRNRMDPHSTASQVHYRGLDSVAWKVKSYDPSTGDALLVRCVTSQEHKFIDQFDPPPEGSMAERGSEQLSTPFKRRADVRQYVLVRANGKCEYCGSPGFTTTTGQVYLETHHLVPLSREGPDTVSNVVALCPNHHREAHYRADRNKILELLLEKLRD